MQNTELPKNRYSLIAATPEERAKDAELVKKRYEASRKWHEPYFIKWVRYYKIWRSLAEKVDAIEDEDEPNAFIAYAFSLVEDLHSKIIEPILKMGSPLIPKPKKPGHEKQAEAFGAVARTHFTSDEWQLGFMSAGKERIITGSMWEMDEWANDHVEEERWTKRPRPQLVDVMMQVAEKILPAPMMQMLGSWHLITEKSPVRVGYQTSFWSVFHVLPEPGVKDLKKLQWAILEEPSVPINSLEKAVFIDPDTKKPVPCYDLTELTHDLEGKTCKPELQGRTSEDYYEQARGVMAGGGSGEADKRSSDDGISRVHLMHQYAEDGTVTTVAQGKYVIRKFKSPQRRIPLRIRVYTVDPMNLHGLGAVEPIEDLVYENNDIHNLSMSNLWRIINRMVAVDVSKIADEEELEYESGGIWRFRGNVHDAVSPIQHNSVFSDMIGVESNSKGLMEKISGAADLSPGVQGTKQGHDTATGVLEIQRNMAARMAIMRRVDMACFKDQMWMMERMFSFYQFAPGNFQAQGPDGTTTNIEVSNETIYTDGVGFDFVWEHDPSFGDDFVQRASLGEWFDRLMKYEQWRTTVGGPEEPKADMANIIRRMGKSYGFMDTTYFLKPVNGLISPDEELRIMLAGGRVQVRPFENLTQHMVDHLNQRNDPEFLQAVASGKVPPEVVAALDEHLQQTNELIQHFAQDPGAFAEEANQRKIQNAPPEDAQMPEANA